MIFQGEAFFAFFVFLYFFGWFCFITFWVCFVIWVIYKLLKTYDIIGSGDSKERYDYMNRKWLKHQYYEKGRSLQEIAEDQNVSMIKIKKWIDKMESGSLKGSKKTWLRGKALLQLQRS